jgi:hypothetical protein
MPFWYRMIASFAGAESPPLPTSSFQLPFASFHPPHPGLTPLWHQIMFKCHCEHLVLLAPPLLHLPLLFSALSASFRRRRLSFICHFLFSVPYATCHRHHLCSTLSASSDVLYCHPVFLDFLHLIICPSFIVFMMGTAYCSSPLVSALRGTQTFASITLCPLSHPFLFTLQ